MLDWLIHTVRVQVPDGWTEKSPGSALDTADPKAPRSLVVESEQLPGPMDVQAYSARVLSVLKQQLMAYQLVSDRARTILGMAAIQRVHTFSLQGKPVAQVQLYLVHQRRAYTFTVGQLSASGAAPLAVAEDIFRQIKRASPTPQR